MKIRTALLQFCIAQLVLTAHSFWPCNKMCTNYEYKVLVFLCSVSPFVGCSINSSPWLPLTAITKTRILLE